MVKQLGADMDQKFTQQLHSIDQKLNAKNVEDMQTRMEILRRSQIREQELLIAQLQARSQFGSQYGPRYGPQ